MTKEFIRKVFLYGDEDEIQEFIDKYFGGNIKRSIDFLEKYDIFNDDDNVKDWYINHYPNTILLHRLENDPKDTLEYIIGQLSDVEQKGDKILMTMSDRQSLSNFFYDSNSARYTTARDIAEKVLSDDHYDFFNYGTSIDVESIISELDSNNITILKDTFLKRNLDSSEFTLYDEPFVVNKENMDEISDKELYKLVEQDNYLSDELKNLFNHSYEYAYSDDLWNEVSGGLKDLFETDNYFTENSFKVKRVDGTEITRHNGLVDITNIFKDAVEKALKDNMNYDEDAFYSGGDFETILVSLLEDDFKGGLIDFRVPDYPDHSKVTQNMNSMFSDYI
jgi:hypothetical protein